MVVVNGTEEPSMPEAELTPYVFGLFIAFVSILLNGFLLLVLAKQRKSFLHMRVTYYIINLGIADFLNGLVISILVMSRVFQIELTRRSQDTLVLFNWVTLQCSFYTLVLMSVDRLVIVLYSLSWTHILTVRRAIMSIVILWVVSAAGGVLMHFYETETQLGIMCFVELSILIFICNSLFIYPVLKRREKARFVTTVSSNQTVYSRRVLYPLPYDNMSRVVLILIVMLTVTQLPFIICLQMWIIHELSGGVILNVVRTKLFLTGYAYAQSFACLNFAMNPVVYAWRIKKYREAFADMICW